MVVHAVAQFCGYVCISDRKLKPIKEVLFRSLNRVSTVCAPAGVTRRGCDTPHESAVRIFRRFRSVIVSILDSRTRKIDYYCLDEKLYSRVDIVC